MRMILSVTLCLLALGTPGIGEEPTVPSWFKPDPKNPYAIFDAWRNLSTTEAVLYSVPGWNVCAGVLRDDGGKPLGNCPLTFSFDADIRVYEASLKTDKDGFFIIYSPFRRCPYALRTLADPQRAIFWADPGYPFSQAALLFARTHKGFKVCKARVVPVSADRCFCVLTCSAQSNYNKDEFRRFMEQKTAPSPRQPREKPQPRQGSADRGIRNEYPVKVVSPQGAGIPDALVRFKADDHYEGNDQTVATDKSGDCTLIEELLSGQDQKYYDGVRRWLAVDIPGYAVGPIPFDLKKGMVNLIRAKEGASIYGRLADWNGNPFTGRISVQYENPNICMFDLDLTHSRNGYFTIDRIMPGEPFRLHADPGSDQFTPIPCADCRSDVFTLKAGEKRTGIVLTIPQAAAVCGIVVDEKDHPVAGLWNLSCQNEYGERVLYDLRDGRFGTGPVPPIRLRIKAWAKGFQPYTSEDIPLKPGEMRFVKVVMKREASSDTPQGDLGKVRSRVSRTPVGSAGGHGEKSN